MSTLWQLRKISTGEALNDPQPLPENWGPIFGLEGVKYRLSDLSWVGMNDLGWFELSAREHNQYSLEQLKKEVDDRVLMLLSNSSEKVAVDNSNITKGDRERWVEYRNLLKEVKYQHNYPYEVIWPQEPI